MNITLIRLLVVAVLGGRQLSLSPRQEALRALVGAIVVTKATHTLSTNRPGGHTKMALNFPTPTNAAPVAAARTDRPKAELWVNIGLTVPMTNPVTGEAEDTFIALPVGLPLDTMESLEIKGNNPNWANMVQAKNWLLEELQKVAAGITPGNAEVIDGLQIQIRRTGAAAAPVAGQNPLLAAMSGKLSVVS